MEQQSKVPLDVEEQIQSLAGDIYVQIEDKITAFVSTYANSVEITDEVIENHLLYQSLQANCNQLKSDFEKANSAHDTDIKAYQKTLSTLEIQISSRDDTIKNNEQLNTAKLTDTEQVLKDKLVELSDLTASFNQLTAENKTQLKSLEKATEQLDESTQQIKKLELSEHTLAKNDKAKTATLAVQNHQISDLTLQLNNVTSELDYLKAEHSQQSESSSKQLSQEQSAIKQYQNEIKELKQKIVHFEVSLSTEVTKKKTLEDNVNELTQSISDRDKTLGHEKVVTDKLNQEIETLRKSNTAIETLLKDEKQAMKLLETNMAELSKGRSSVSEQLIQEQKNVENYKAEVIKCKDKILELEKGLSTEADSSESLQSQVVGLTQTIDELNTVIDKEKGDSAQVKSELLTMQKTLELLNERFKMSETDKKEAERLLSVEKQTQGQHKSKHLLEIDSLKQSIDKHRAELEAQRSSNEQSKTNVDKLNQTIIYLEKDKALSLQANKEKDDLYKANLVELKNTLSQEKNIVKEYIAQLDSQKTLLAKQTEINKAKLDKLEKAGAESSKRMTELDNKRTSLEKNIIELTTKNKELIKSYEESNTMIDGYQQEIIHLKDHHEKANNNAQEIIKRVEANKGKQESEYTKARDTIKYLRDENLDLNTKLDQQVTALEDKLREYRLRFEYAQKQLNSNP